MSGGAFDYAHFDADQLRAKVSDMADIAEETEEIPDGAAEELRDLAESLDRNQQLMRAVEWYASGDYGAERVAEEWEPEGSE